MVSSIKSTIQNELITHDPSTFKYYQNNLVPGQHMLVLSSKSTPLSGFSVDLDYITAFAATGINSSIVPTHVSMYVNLSTTILGRY